jgi:hypothetical protein
MPTALTEGTQAIVRALDSRELLEIGAQIILGDGDHLSIPAGHALFVSR